MSLNPETLAEDSEEEREERRRRVGSENGLYVSCAPVLGEPSIVEQRSRVVCLSRPYQACESCCHSRFSLVFDTTPGTRYSRVMCPRWSGPGRRIEGEKPEYVVTEVATCGDQPFEFCASCPSIEKLKELDIDKTKDGWYSRWKRFMEVDLDD